MTNKSKKNNLKLKLIYFALGIILLAAISIFLYMRSDSADKKTNLGDENYYKFEVYKDVTIQTDNYTDKENQGFNKMTLILGADDNAESNDKEVSETNDKETTDTTEKEITIVDTTANLKFSINKSSGTPFYKIDKHSSLVAIYEYTTNISEGLDEEDKIRSYHAEFLIIDDNGEVESLGTSDKVFVSLTEDKNGDLILKEKLYIDGYTHIPSWDRPHVLYTSKFENGVFQLVDKKEVHEF